MKKNLFKFAFTFVIASILLSSCSITKRHYTNGYYVSHSSGKQTAAKAQEPVAQKKVKPSLHTLQNTADDNNVGSDLKQTSVPENGSVTASNKQTVTKTTTPAVKNNSTKHPLFSTVMTPVRKKDTSVSTKKIVADSLAGDALSLFWIIILILLILWLVAILSGGWGLGGFVYILLVVALILLILWLLRIV
jgi:Flp pilus assembly protein TadB